MPTRTDFEQHVAVFGESGSGKTVLVSSVYGAMQEPGFLQSSLYRIVAEDPGQGARLHRNYLGMRDSARVPDQTRFAPESYRFTLRLKDGDRPTGVRRRARSIRLVWHDYPGEWFEQGVSGAEEAHRRVDTFRSLLRSDVALLMVDGQRLVDNSGEEERYLKSLFGDLRNGLLALKDDLLDEGEPLTEFPRIWVLALSKADLLADLDVFTFRDLLIDRASGEIDELRRVIEGFVESNEALSVGEDFVLLSSAKFEPDRIEVHQRVGLDLVLPLAAALPLERHLRWAERKVFGAKLAGRMLGGLLRVLSSLSATVVKTGSGRPNGSRQRQSTKRAKAGAFADLAFPIIIWLAEESSDQLLHVRDGAEAKRDYLTAVLAGFRLDLKRGEDQRILLRSRR